MKNILSGSSKKPLRAMTYELWEDRSRCECGKLFKYFNHVQGKGALYT